MKIIDVAQLSPEWWEARRGIPTASNFGRILTPKKMELSRSADEYICELIAERRGCTLGAGISSKAAQDGLATEPEARRWYEMATDCDVRQVGLCVTDCGRFACSPDGLIGEDGGLEIKCPLLKTHVRYVLEGSLPEEYKSQVHGQLIVTGRKWVDFLSYVPGQPPFRVRVTPDSYTSALKAGLEEFWIRFKGQLALYEAMEAA